MRVHHLALRTADLAGLERFYANVLGLTVTRRNDEYSVWLDAGGTILMLERSSEEEPHIPVGSLELVAFAIAAEEHASVRRRLDAAGVTIEGRTPYSVYFRDPDGRRVGISSYPDALASC